MHQYQQGENGQPVKIQDLRIFLQTNIVRSSDTDKMHFSHCWLRLSQMQANISSFNLERTFYRLINSPTPLYLNLAIRAKLWTATLIGRRAKSGIIDP